MTTKTPIRAGSGVRVVGGTAGMALGGDFHGKYLSITTYKRDGTAVSTPVWFVAQHGRLLIETDAGSGKVKRIKNDPRVAVALCSARGREVGPRVNGRATILPPSEVSRLEPDFMRKYRRDLIFIKPIRAVQSIFRRGTPSPVILAVIPD